MQRKCSICGNKTYVKPNGCEDWYNNKDTGLKICRKCYFKKYYLSHKKKFYRYRETHKDQRCEYSRGYNRRRVVFKGRVVVVESCPRLGRCSNCGRRVGIDGIKRTNMHHDEYYDDDPLKQTREVCVSCHSKKHVLIRNGGQNRRCSICYADNTYIDSSGYEYWLFDKHFSQL